MITHYIKLFVKYISFSDKNVMYTVFQKNNILCKCFISNNPFLTLYVLKINHQVKLRKQTTSN